MGNYKYIPLHIKKANTIRWKKRLDLEDIGGGVIYGILMCFLWGATIQTLLIGVFIYPTISRIYDGITYGERWNQ